MRMGTIAMGSLDGLQVCTAHTGFMELRKPHAACPRQEVKQKYERKHSDSRGPPDSSLGQARLRLRSPLAKRVTIAAVAHTMPPPIQEHPAEEPSLDLSASIVDVGGHVPVPRPRRPLEVSTTLGIQLADGAEVTTSTTHSPVPDTAFTRGTGTTAQPGSGVIMSPFSGLEIGTTSPRRVTKPGYMSPDVMTSAIKHIGDGLVYLCVAMTVVLCLVALAITDLAYTSYHWDEFDPSRAASCVSNVRINLVAQGAVVTVFVLMLMARVSEVLHEDALTRCRRAVRRVSGILATASVALGVWGAVTMMSGCAVPVSLGASVVLLTTHSFISLASILSVLMYVTYLWFRTRTEA